MTDVPPDVKQELRRSVAFVAVIDLWTAYGVSEQTVNKYLQPHKETVEKILDEYPSLDPKIDQNPAAYAEDNLRQIGLLDNETVEIAFEGTREFFSREDTFLVGLEVEE